MPKTIRPDWMPSRTGAAPQPAGYAGDWKQAAFKQVLNLDLASGTGRVPELDYGPVDGQFITYNECSVIQVLPPPSNGEIRGIAPVMPVDP